MRIPVSVAVQQLDERGLIERQKPIDPVVLVEHVRELINRTLPPDLVDFLNEQVRFVGNFQAVFPAFNERVGWNPDKDDTLKSLLHVNAIPIFFDGVGNRFGLDLTTGGDTPGVYFFDHERGFDRPVYAAGSSLGAFLLLLSHEDEAVAQDWPADWHLKIDPDIDKCPRAPPPWVGDVLP